MVEAVVVFLIRMIGSSLSYWIARLAKKSKLKKPSIAKVVAIGFLASEWQASAMGTSAGRAFHSSQAVWLLPLAEACIKRFESTPSLELLMKFVATNAAFRLAVKVYNVKTARLSRILDGRSIVSIQWDLPSIETFAALADWLGVRRCDLNWLANLHSSDPPKEFQTGKHYVCTWIRKRSSGLRLIESPKPLLKDAQRQINAEMLSNIKPHEVAHGFRRGRNVVTFVVPHVNKPVCLKMDLRDFFPSVTFGRVWGVFCNAGYSRDVSRYLAAI